MSQLILTPHGTYKFFRNLVIGYTGAGGVEADGFYINRAIGTNPVSNLKFFKLGQGGPVDGNGDTVDLTRDWFDANVKENGNTSGTYKGGVAEPIYIDDPAGGESAQRKNLIADNFYNYGDTVDSKVIGVLSIREDPAGTEYWNIPGVAFQVGCHLTPDEGNWDKDQIKATPPAVVVVNEIGIYDDDDVLIFYGVFPKQNKNETLTLKVNGVCMLKTLDFQLTLP